MDKLPFSFTSNLCEILSCVDYLQQAIASDDRCNIVRSCSTIMYSLSDILEQVIPDGYVIEVKPSKPLENGNS